MLPECARISAAGNGPSHSFGGARSAGTASFYICFCSIAIIVACIVMIMVSLGMLEGSYVTEGLSQGTL